MWSGNKTRNALKFTLKGFVFQNFLEHAPDPHSITLLHMLIVLCIVTFMTTHHPKFSIHIALWLVGLTTKKLLPLALPYTTLNPWNKH